MELDDVLDERSGGGLMTRFDGVFFDMDGTILDSYVRRGGDYWYIDGWRDVAERLGLPMTEEIKRAVTDFELGSAGVIDTVEPLGLDPQFFWKVREEYYMARRVKYTEDGTCTLYEDYLELMPFLSGLKRGLVTNGKEAYIPYMLDFFDIHDHFDGFIGRSFQLEDLDRLKPKPDFLLNLADQLDVDPERVLLIGDSDADVFSAKAAGMASIIVKREHNVGKIETLPADAIVSSLLEVKRHL